MLEARVEALSLFETTQQTPARSPRRRNALWDAFEEIFEYSPLTESEIKLWGKLTWSLARAGATRESLIFAASEYHKEFPTASLTPNALEKHYSRFAAKKRRKVVVCDSCGIGGGHHLADCPKVEARIMDPGLGFPTPLPKEEARNPQSQPMAGGQREKEDAYVV